jgi:hypothetical protein
MATERKPQIPKTSMTTHHHLPKGECKTFTISIITSSTFYLYILNIPRQPTCKISDYSKRFPVFLDKKC